MKALTLRWDATAEVCVLAVVGDIGSRAGVPGE
jgi:hypothetical protein